MRRSSRALNQRSAALVAGMTILGGGVASADIARMIPNDAGAAFWVNNMTKLTSAAKESAVGQFFADPALAKAVALVEEAFQKQASNLTEEQSTRVREFLDAVNGAAALYLYRPAEAGEFEDTPEFVLLAELDEAGLAWFERFRPEIGKNLTEVTKSTITVGEDTVFRIVGMMDTNEEPDPLGLSDFDDEDELDDLPTQTIINYAIVNNGMLYMSSTANTETITRQVALITGAAADNLTTRRDAASVSRHFTSNPASATAFVNLEAIIDIALENADNGSIPDLRGKLAGLGLLDFKGLYTTISFDEKATTITVDGTVPDGTRGVMDAFFAARTIELDLLNGFPSDSLGAAAFHFDFGRLWDAIIAGVESFQPGASAFVSLPLLSFQAQYGVDPLNSILRNIGGTHYSYQPRLTNLDIKLDPTNPLSGMETSGPLLISFRNPDETFAAFNTLLGNLKNDPNYGTSFELEQTADRLIVRAPESLRENSETPIPVASISRQGLVFGPTEQAMLDMHRTLAGLHPGKLGETAEYQTALARLDRNGLLAYSYTSGVAWGIMMEQFRRAFQQSAALLPGGEEAEAFVEALPPASVYDKYLGTTTQTVHRRDTTVTIEWRMDGR